MRPLLWAVFLTVFTTIRCEENIQYDAAAIKRFDEELRKLGITLSSLTQLDQPEERFPPTVTSSAGDFEGYWMQSQFGRPIASFEGIPYAQPPVGDLRFREAQPLSTRLEGFKATKPGGICSQRSSLFVNTEVTGQEDCLFLNVYVPVKVDRSGGEKLPVMVYVHGGGFVEGQGDIFKSNILLDKDVLYVTLNYRLGLLGFLATEDGTIPGNLGLKDQVAALRWVRDNIGAFGGNPNLVTVFGQSSGGGSVDLLMLSPLTHGLIHRVIAMSGFATAGWVIEYPGETRGRLPKVAEQLGCPLEPTADFVACLRGKDHDKITAVDFVFPGWGATPHIYFKAVVEGNIPGAFLPYHPKKMFADHLYNDVPYMAGVVSEEGSIVAPVIFNNETQLQELNERFNEIIPLATSLQYPPQQTQETLDTLRRVYFGTHNEPLQKSQVMQAANLFTDIMFLWPMMKSLSYRRKTALAPSYVYYFNYAGSHSMTEMFGLAEKYGVSHSDELIYLLPHFDQLSPSDVYMSIILTGLLTSFARDGVPQSNLLNTDWYPASTINDMEYFHIKSPVDIHMRRGLLTERWTLVNKLLGEPEDQHLWL